MENADTAQKSEDAMTTAHGNNVERRLILILADLLSNAGGFVPCLASCFLLVIVLPAFLARLAGTFIGL